MPMAPMSRSGRKPIWVFLPRLPQKRDTGNRLEIGVDTPLSNSSNGAGAPAAAFGKTAFADFASRGIKMSEKMDIVLQSDFGLSTGYVASMYGVIRSIDKEIAVYDLNHEIRPFDMKQASQMLAATVKYWPADTVFVSVVDPGVGTARIPCVAELKSGQYIVTPDNGTLTDVAGQIEAVRKIDEK